MTLEHHSDEKNGNKDEVLPKKRLSVTIDEIDSIIIEKIAEAMGNSKSSWVYNIIKRYINENSDKIRQELNIDIIGIRKQYLAELKGFKGEYELNDLERMAIEKMLTIFKTVSSMDEARLKQILNLNQESFDKILFFNPDELEKYRLKLKYKQGIIFKP